MSRPGNLDSDKRCDNCGRTGHIKINCFQKGGGKEGQYPAWWRGKKDTNIPTLSAAVMTTIMADSIRDFPQHYGMTAALTAQVSTGVYADSATTEHFLWNKSDFLTYTPCNWKGQSSEQGTELNIIGTGRAKKVLLEGDKEVVIILENAFHSPNVSNDLISISRMDALGYFILFGNGCVKFYSPGGTHFLTGIGSHGLYELKNKCTEDILALATRSCSLNHPTDLATWHHRFAHAGLYWIEMLVKKNMVDGLMVTKPSVEGDCEDCHVGKAIWQPFDAAVNLEKDLLECVHADLMGLMHTMARGGYFYSFNWWTFSLHQGFLPLQQRIGIYLEGNGHLLLMSCEVELSKLDMSEINFQNNTTNEFNYQLFNSEGWHGQSICLLN